MQRIMIELGPQSYPYWLGDTCLDEIVHHIRSLQADRYFVVTDEILAPLYAAQIQRSLASTDPADLIVHMSGEGSKTLATVGILAERLLALGATRASCVVAVGGGVTGNVAGLLAGLLFRGIRLIHVPTTLVAVLDSVISLKQAISTADVKNGLGLFYCPEMVLTDVSFLQSLPISHVRSGLCEVIKNAVAICPKEIAFLTGNLGVTTRYGGDFYAELIRRNIQAKVDVIRNDPHEQYHGLAFEYGHTVGHAIEVSSQGELSHGEAVGLGMLAAAEVGILVSSGLSARDVDVHRALLTQIGALLKIPGTIKSSEVLLRTTLDNKKGYLASCGHQLGMVVLAGLGRPRFQADRPLFPVPMDIVERAINTIS